MESTLTALQERLNKAKAKREKSRISHENWGNECDRIAIAISVLAEMSGDSLDSKAAPVRSTPSQKVVRDALGRGKENALSPLEIYEIVRKVPGFENDVNYVRTTLWRLGRDRVIGNAQGRYWHFADSENTLDNKDIEEGAADNDDAGVIEQQGEAVQFDPDLDDDSDLPF
jgi:hypothetical protein